jgi:predicted RNase H-like HicB family nuclease
MTSRYTAIIEREGDGFVALCPEFDIASQGADVSEARANLQEAVELFLETASASEVKQRFKGEVYVTQIEVALG